MLAAGRRKILFLTDVHTVSTNLKRKGCEAALAEEGLALQGDLNVGLSNQINQTRDYLLKLRGLDVDGIGHIPSFKDQGIDIEFTGMDYFAVRSTVDAEKQEILRDFVLKVYAEPDFQKFMADMGMAAWEADSSEILGMVAAQTDAMAKYIPLVQ